jgi:hypothetical protein
MERDGTAKTELRGWQMAPGHALSTQKDKNIYTFLPSFL